MLACHAWLGRGVSPVFFSLYFRPPRDPLRALVTHSPPARPHAPLHRRRYASLAGPTPTPCHVRRSIHRDQCRTNYFRYTATGVGLTSKLLLSRRRDILAFCGMPSPWIPDMCVGRPEVYDYCRPRPANHKITT